MKDIYELFNEINIDFSNVKDMEMNELERKRGKKKLIKTIVKGRNKWSKLAAIISIFVIASTVSIIASNPILAASVPTIGDLFQKLIDVNPKYENYMNVIGKTETIDGIDVTFENAVADKNMFFLSFIVRNNNKTIKNEFDACVAPMNLKVNGKEVNASGTAGCEKIDENTVRVLRTIDWNYKKLPKKMDIEIVMGLPELNNKIKDFEIKFSIDTKQVEKNTYIKKVDKNFVIDGINCNIEEVVISPLVTNIKYYAETEDEGFNLDFLVLDQDDREVKLKGGSSSCKGSENYTEGRIDFNMNYINTDKVNRLKLIPIKKKYIEHLTNESLKETMKGSYEDKVLYLENVNIDEFNPLDFKLTKNIVLNVEELKIEGDELIVRYNYRYSGEKIVPIFDDLFIKADGVVLKESEYDPSENNGEECIKKYKLNN